MLPVRSYARAVFELGQSRDRTDAYGDGLAKATGVLKQYPELIEFFNNPSIPDGEKKSLVEDISEGHIPVTILRLLYLLIDKGRVPLLPGIKVEYDKMVLASRNRVVCRVAIAAELDDYSELTEYLVGLTGAEVILEVSVDPSLLGGFKARIGDRIIDASIKGNLDKMRQSIWQGV